MRSIMTTAALLCAATTSANALQHPKPVGDDPHVQVARYNQADPVLVVGAVGRPLTITFGASETIRQAILDAGYVADGKTIEAPWNGPDPAQQGSQPLRNILPLWAVRAGRSSAEVITGTEDGTNRTYHFVLVALPAQVDDCTPPPGQDFEDCDDPRLTAGLSFTYPPELHRPTEAEQAATQAATQRRIAAAKLATRVAAEDRLKTDIFYGARNWKYVVKGKPQAAVGLAPDEMSDNTQVTGLLYLGNRKVPALYVVTDGAKPCDPESKDERQVSPELDKDLLVIAETARHWRLRKGPTEVIDVCNVGFDAIGANPFTGTISPNVLRVTKAVR